MIVIDMFRFRSAADCTHAALFDDQDRLEAAAHYLDRAGVVPEHARELRDAAIARARGLVQASG